MPLAQNSMYAPGGAEWMVNGHLVQEGAHLSANPCAPPLLDVIQ